LTGPSAALKPAITAPSIGPFAMPMLSCAKWYSMPGILRARRDVVCADETRLGTARGVPLRAPDSPTRTGSGVTALTRTRKAFLCRSCVRAFVPSRLPSLGFK
jgi:hypothetical protein